MLTPGEAISAVIRYYVSYSQVGDIDLRQKYLFFMQEGGDKLWTMAPVWWRLGDGTVSLTGADPIGSLPTNFAQFGDQGHVYVNGQPGRPALRYVAPAAMAGVAEANTDQTQFPLFYTLWQKTSLGRNQLRVHPTPNANLTLNVQRYVRRAPYFIDIPTAPNVAQGAAGNVDIGAHRWKIVFANPFDVVTTEGGIASVTETIVAAAKQVLLTDIPVSPVWSVSERSVYRTVAGGEEFFLVDSIGDNFTTTFLDDASDLDLGASCPVPAAATGCGMEQYPEDWQRTLLYEYLKAAAAQGQGDIRDQKWFDNWQTEVRRMWAEMKQGQNFPSLLPRYGQKFQIGRVPTRTDRLRNA